MFALKAREGQPDRKARVSKYLWLGTALMLSLGLLSALGLALAGRGIQGMASKTAFPGVVHRDISGSADVSCLLSPTLVAPFYGMQFVPVEDLAKAKELGAEVILMDLPHNGTPADWLALLNAAQALDIRVVPWLWPQGWTWDGAAWQIDAQAKSFLQTVAGHPALFAVYALHEPYWNGCDGCGYTTATQQALYSAIKAIANVPLYSEIGSISGWTARGPATAFADGVCDYCATWYYPFKEGGIYERDNLIAHITEELAVAKERAPHSRIVWIMPAYAYAPDQIRMPSADEMRDLASIVYSTDVAGAWWYPWKFGDLYSDFLFNHPELYPVVPSIYEGSVRTAKAPCCKELLHADFTHEPAPIVVSSTVRFTSTTSVFCGPLTYAWEWGDGTGAAYTADAAHQYLAPGTYTVTLSVTNSFLYTDAVAKAVNVIPFTHPPVYPPPMSKPTESSLDWPNSCASRH